MLLLGEWCDFFNEVIGYIFWQKIVLFIIYRINIFLNIWLDTD